MTLTRALLAIAMLFPAACEASPGAPPRALSDARRRPLCCPKCSASPVTRILYGARDSVPEEVKRGEAVQRGCGLSPGDPDWLCSKCHHEWFDASDPDKQALEAWLASLLDSVVIPADR